MMYNVRHVPAQSLGHTLPPVAVCYARGDLAADYTRAR